ncbi:MAG: OmpA family protein [Saprospiraceae bacterium]
MNNCAPISNTPVDWSASLCLMDGDSMLLKGFDHFNFDKNSISPDLSLNNQDFLDQITSYLKANPTKYLTITGLYRNAEKGESSGIYENLGIARANTIRDFLVQRGIDIKRISLDHAAIVGEDLRMPLRFDLFEPTPEGYDEVDDLAKTQFRFDNMTFSDANFEFNSDVFKPGNAFNIWADSVLIYFDNNADKALTIIGHTDNLGTVQYNQDLGLRRAQSAKAFFEKSGLETIISTTTQGEKAPIASNTTETGRQKNRRVNFVIR